MDDDAFCSCAFIQSRILGNDEFRIENGGCTSTGSATKHIRNCGGAETTCGKCLRLKTVVERKEEEPKPLE
jgi:bacterioferritin-associated ferredoxin